MLRVPASRAAGRPEMAATTARTGRTVSRPLIRTPPSPSSRSGDEVAYMLDKRSHVVTIAGRDPSREIRLMRGSRCTTEPPDAGVDLANPGRPIADCERPLMHEMGIDPCAYLCRPCAYSPVLVRPCLRLSCSVS